jgi:DNA topoisomerase-3
MLAGEKSKLLQGFVSNRTKRKFAAFLKYDFDEGRPTFEFEARKKKTAKKKTAGK